MKLSELLFSNEYASRTCADKIEIISIAHKIEDVKSGTLFICLRGQKLDTHVLIPSVLAHGAAAIVVENTFDADIAPNAPIFYVSSCRRTFANVWSRFCGSPSDQLKLIGITGTNGKTSTAYLLDSILRASGIKTAMIGTLGFYIDGENTKNADDPRCHTMTTPDPDLLFPFLKRAFEHGVTHVVMEVSSHALAYDKVAPITFDDAIFTNLSPEHLDFHSSMDEYADAKKKLFLQTRHATINQDDACGAAITSTLTCPHTTCGVLWDSDVMASQLTANENDTYSYFYKNVEIRQLVHLRIGGEYQVYNSLLALSSAIYLGIPAGDATRALEHVHHIPGRLQLVSDKDDDIRVYIDFAHTETALRALLINLKRTTTSNLVVVFGCGGERDTTKRAPMGRCAMEHADYTIITSDNTRNEDVTSIIKDILMGHTSPEKRRVIVDRERAIRYAIRTAKCGDTIVLAGKGHENYEIKNDDIFPFSEEDIAKDALKTRRSEQMK